MQKLFFLALSLFACQSQGMETKKCPKHHEERMRTWYISRWQPYAFVKGIGELEKELHKHTVLTLLTSERIDRIMQAQESVIRKDQKVAQELLRLRTSFQKIQERYNRCEKYVPLKRLQEIKDILNEATLSLNSYRLIFNPSST